MILTNTLYVTLSETLSPKHKVTTNSTFPFPKMALCVNYSNAENHFFSCLQHYSQIQKDFVEDDHEHSVSVSSGHWTIQINCFSSFAHM